MRHTSLLITVLLEFAAILDFIIWHHISFCSCVYLCVSFTAFHFSYINNPIHYISHCIYSHISFTLCSCQLSSWQSKEEDEKKKAISEEESIVYSLAILFANRMIYLTVPLDAHEQMVKYNERRKKKDGAIQRLQNTGRLCFES